MKTIVIILLVVLAAGSSFALTGLTEGAVPDVEKLLAKVKEGQEFVFIDDMAFRVETLRKTGFIGSPWPGGYVYYQFDEGVDAWQRDNWRAAAALWSQVANLTFVEDVGCPPLGCFISVFEHASRNYSEVGWQGFPQEMGLATWNDLYIIAHEICHALGFVHEQSRTDRDTYVEIVWDNIIDEKEHNYEIRDTVNLTPYDFDSLMHYGPGGGFLEPGLVCPPDCAILVREPWNAQWQWAIGQRDHFSAYDIAGVSAIYGVPCHGPIYVDFWHIVPGNGSSVYPFPSLATALDYACAGAEIRLKAGQQPFAPILISDDVLLTSYGGSAVID
jgi:hypothetical protein